MGVDLSLTMPCYEIWVNMPHPTTGSVLAWQFYSKALTLADVAHILKSMNAAKVGYNSVKVVQVLNTESIMKFAE